MFLSAPTGFVRAIGRLDAVAIVVGSMIGSGIFIVSADITRQVHSPALLLAVWTISGLITILAASAYAELSAMFPHAGGQYVYLREGISPLFAYLFGWTFFAVIQTGTIAAVAVAFARFTAVLFPALSGDLFLGRTMHLPTGTIQIGFSAQRILAILSVIALTWINVRGVRTAAIIQTSLTAIKTAALAALMLLGLTVGRNAAALSANFGPAFWPADFSLATVSLIGGAMVGSLFAMSAWYNVGFAASELKHPERDIPFAMMAGVGLVTLLYVLTNAGYLSTLPSNAIAGAPQDRVGTAAMQAMFGDAGLYAMTVAIMISTFGANNGLILAGARVTYAMAKDGLFFAKAGTLDQRYYTPRWALIAQATWTSVLCLSGTYTQLLDYVVFAAVLFYGLTVAGMFRLRMTRPDLARPVKALGYPWLPGLYVLITAAICINLLIRRPQYAGLGLAIVALGVPVYLLWRRVAPRGSSTTP